MEKPQTWLPQDLNCKNTSQTWQCFTDVFFFIFFLLINILINAIIKERAMIVIPINA